jgi:hypothetical protein
VPTSLPPLFKKITPHIMRIFLSTCLLFCLVSVCPAQFVKPFTWTYTAKKTGANMYELHFKIAIDAPWHIYSQNTPEGGPIPTVIKFNTNPLVSLQGKAKETGKMKQVHEEVFDVDVKYYDGKVDFVQLVKVKGNIKTNVSGTISYMICKEGECLPYFNDKFNFKLQ